MMETQDQIVNRVAGSNLVTFDLETLYRPGKRVVLDIQDQLYQGLILKEKDFRAFVKDHPWSQYAGQFVAITCSADAVVPTWAYMLVALALEPHAEFFVFGSLEELETRLFTEALARVDWSQYQDARVVVKGCSKVAVPQAVYVEATRLLKPRTASLMFGEPCSTVPLYKRPKAS